MTIHQPAADLLDLFDRLLIMGDGGKLIFSGAPNDALSFISRHTSRELPQDMNPFEYILQILDDGPNLESMYNEYISSSEQVKKSINTLTYVMKSPINTHYLSFFQQVFIQSNQFILH